ncbi:hypothetical protein [Micromonospora sediminicola]|uniref:hypothetical protein n=1 Tax=Micromonospora sediminicola TaxID=946078 RepID=UPI0037A40B0E
MHRFTTLALAALAVLGICAADAAENPADTGLIKVTVNEVRRLINACFIRRISDVAHRLHWSGWRRRHQARARRAHYNAASTSNFNHEPERRRPY